MRGVSRVCLYFFQFSSSLPISKKVDKAEKIDPVLIVGSGLTAADAVLCAYNNNVPVIHVFRRRVTDRSSLKNC